MTTHEEALEQSSGWLGECRQMAAQCWGDESTKHLTMEPALAEAFAHRLALWMDTGAQHARNEQYWHDEYRRAEAELAALRAAQPEQATPPLPADMVMVPKEPTEDVLDAAIDGFGIGKQLARDPEGHPKARYLQIIFTAVYKAIVNRAMIAAYEKEQP